MKTLTAIVIAISLMSCNKDDTINPSSGTSIISNTVLPVNGIPYKALITYVYKFSVHSQSGMGSIQIDSTAYVIAGGTMQQVSDQVTARGHGLCTTVTQGGYTWFYVTSSGAVFGKFMLDVTGKYEVKSPTTFVSF